MHRKVAVHLAQWISPEFAVQVSNWVDELLVTGSVELGNEKTQEEVESVFQKRIGSNPISSYNKEVLYIGEFEPDPKDINSDVRDDQSVYKFGITSDLEKRIQDHGRTYPNFRYLDCCEFKDRKDSSNVEARIKSELKSAGLLAKYKGHQEIFAATPKEYQDVYNRVVEYQKDFPVDDVVFDKEVLLAYLQLQREKEQMQREREKELVQLLRDGLLSPIEMQRMFEIVRS